MDYNWSNRIIRCSNLYEEIMAKKNTKLIIGIAILALAIFFIGPKLGLFAQIGTSTMTRGVPATITPSSSFQITYTAGSVPTGKWGAIIVETITGGCKFADGTASYKSALLSSDGTTKTITLTAPASGSCSISGYYQYDAAPGSNQFGTVNIPVYVCQPSCVRPTNQCTEAATVSNGCSGVCTGSWTVAKKSEADTDCNNLVADTEVVNYINKWANSQITDAQVIAGIQAWVLS